MKKRRGYADRGFSRKSRNQSRPILERFENRLLLTVFTVTNTTDSATATANDGSLRGEILASNGSTSALPNQIVFALGTGVQTISPTTPLPAITEPVTIDGSTAQGFSNKPLIQILGSLDTQGGAGLTASAAGVTIQDLIIDGFSGDGIDLTAPGNDTLTGDFIGTNPAGTAALANTGIGVSVTSPNNTIGKGGSLPNIISGNNVGVEITGTGNTQNLVANNYIGTDFTGKVAVANTGYGVVVNTGGTTNFFGSTPGNTIGGVSAGGLLGSGNLISGNGAGLSIATVGANGNLVTGNFIGTDITGLKALKNLADGIDLSQVTQTTIGGTTTGAANVISGNGADGIQISGTSARLNLIEGNDIGVGGDGSTAVGNSNNGVLISGSSQNTVGGVGFGGTFEPALGNIIANNGIGSTNFFGVEISTGSGDAVLSNSIYGNGGLGIKLNQGNAGIQPPTLFSAESGAGQTQISGTYNGSPNETYDIQFFSSQTPNPAGNGDGKNYLGDLQVTANSSGSVNFTTILNTEVPVGYSVSATATDGIQTINNTSQFATNVQDTQAPVSNITVTSSGMSVTSGTVSGASPSTPLYDQNFAYTLTITNAGPDDDTNVVLTDTLPTGVTYISSAIGITPVGTVANGVVTIPVGTVPADGSVIVTVTVKPNQVGSITNSATVTGDALVSTGSVTTVTQTDTVVPDSDLAVLITPGFTGSETPIGSPITYAITVSNFGPSSGNGVTATVSLPADFTNVSVSQDQGSYSIDSNNNLTLNVGLLGVSSSDTILITATPEATGTATVTASVTSPIADPNDSNNTATPVSVVVANAADLAIGITGSPDPVLIGQDLLYTVTVTNNGPSSASEPVVTDLLPAGLTYDPTNSSANGNGSISYSSTTGEVTANLNALLANSTATITIAVIPTAAGSVTNTVNVGDPTLATSVEIDTNPANNTASFTSQVSPSDISVTVDNPADPLFIGSQAVYQIVVTNNGPADAADVTFNDSFSGTAGVTLLNSSVGTISGSSISADLGPLASGASETITIAVDPTSSGTLLDQATVATAYDPDPSNNTSSSTNLVSPVDVGIAVTPSATTLLIGQPLTYNVQVSNSGPATAMNVNFSDVLPANVTIDSITSSQGTLVASGNSSIAGSLGSLASGGTATITIVVTPTVVETAVNTATVTSTENIDTNSSNDSVTTSVSAINLPGTLQFGTPVVLVGENAGSITLTVDRTGGSLGAVTANYATSDYTATAGINYVATSGTISFADGQTTATITIPVIDDGIVDGTHGFFVTLSNVAGGASLGGTSVAAVLVYNTDRDLIPPDVSSLIAIPNGSSINGFIVTFDKAMDYARVTDVTNYHVYLVGANGSQTPVPIAGVSYNVFSHAVTIIPPAPLPGNQFYRVLVNGSYGNALTDTSGNILFGSSGLGTNFDVIYGQGTSLTYDDALGNKVNINITGGGIIGIYLAPNGNAEAVNLYEVVPHKTRLNGSVKKLTKSASGYTLIGLINGFGEFGNVYSTLTTPSFYVDSAPVSYTTVTAKAKATVSKTITAKSVTPKGPKVKLT